MTYPKKKQGFRTIIVDGVHYRWRLNLRYPDSTITLQGPVPGMQQVKITLHNWHDPIFDIDGFDITENDLHLHTSNKNNPRLITSKFAHEAILYALVQGWTPNEKSPVLELDHIDGEFRATLK